MASIKSDSYCKGCIHCGVASTNYICCNYIFNKGHSRPCDPGEGCTVKETRKRGRKKHKHFPDGDANNI